VQALVDVSDPALVVELEGAVDAEGPRDGRDRVEAPRTVDAEGPKNVSMIFHA
jgi:hypothetical protein